jgi:hypothetical protein
MVVMGVFIDLRGGEGRAPQVLKLPQRFKCGYTKVIAQYWFVEVETNSLGALLWTYYWYWCWYWW